MTIYAYRCRTCGAEVDSETRTSVLGACPNCPGELRRSYQVSMEKIVHGHYSPTVSAYVSGNRDFDEKLKRESERISIYQGTEARFERIDPSDKSALGVTEQGIDSSNRIRRQQGLPPLKV